MRRKSVHAAVVGAFTLMCSVTPAVAGPGDLLVTEKMADPDPGYVPPPPEKHASAPQRTADSASSLNQAFENLGRVTAQAAQLAQQRARAQSQDIRRAACNSVESTRSSGIDVSVWDKDCPH